jgi:hypothetical protein
VIAFDSNDPNERDEPTRRGLIVRIAPNSLSAHDHARQLLLLQQRHQGQPPIIPARDQARVQVMCDECDEQMWASITSRNHLCSVCKEKKETDRQSFFGQIMSRFEGED